MLGRLSRYVTGVELEDERSPGYTSIAGKCVGNKSSFFLLNAFEALGHSILISNIELNQVLSEVRGGPKHLRNLGPQSLSYKF